MGFYLTKLKFRVSGFESRVVDCEIGYGLQASMERFFFYRAWISEPVVTSMSLTRNTKLETRNAG
jgi:hypothetical protein